MQYYWVCWGSSVSRPVVSDYRLEDCIRFPPEANDFSSSLCVQTNSEAHPSSYQMGTRSKVQPGHEADHFSAKVENE
jgi:hypothetical protein